MKVPDLVTIYKHCLKCGSEMDPIGNFVKCTNCGFGHFINNFPAVKGIILNKDNEILLGLRRETPNWAREQMQAPEIGMYDMPGGFTDPRETFEQALVRELKEEVNLDIKENEINYYTSYYQDYLLQGLFYPVLIVVFIVRPKSLDNIKGGDDIGKVGFYKPKEIDMSTISFDGQRKMFKKYLETHSK